MARGRYRPGRVTRAYYRRKDAALAATPAAAAAAAATAVADLPKHTIVLYAIDSPVYLTYLQL